VTQQARQLTWTLGERSERVRFLIRDRDQKFSDPFDELFRSAGVEIPSDAISCAASGGGGTICPDGPRSASTGCWFSTPSTSRTRCACSLIIRMAIDLIEPWLSLHPGPRIQSCRNGSALVFSGAIDLAV